MAFTDLFGSGNRARKLGHFSALVNTALLDGPLKLEEEILLLRFARRFDITELEYNEILKNPKKYPIQPPNSSEVRLKQLHDLLVIIFSDHYIDEDEASFLRKYAIAIGFNSIDAEAIVNKSIKIFSGGLDFEDFEYLLKKKQDKSMY
ncbi:MAG: hypothetical protein COZ75_10560 [Flavobacteriaceae bacterium CG_4_8_14_3_um_filter_34_10]|nr:TerB family tellurite resistance protein [Flavobacteriia bacterium]OIP49616.1 MAG: hypothetical protein AUK33_10110 [Flavobacteriaceae bacterium CG2_30_34_30]PIV49747.1 MAG: hypothetical protein COS19_07080 [Flavobacteriaceae bacterium CG02_land_8_20_14_3_00_34_13]PIX08730.1 MAG: hypothetical protein COZ75_10560 [Flavobacteriaceae bacterium CG_4_8_14_3_um_filter_34_10]PIZ08753.1 MAG: hypothetical protein COY56_02370 [Flavobacteriaceae bacterium CG_4_10_14_0_8_um_filter_34_31]PJC07405.1 MAG: